MKSAVNASFRDPSGFVFRQDGEIYRAINQVYKKDYDHLKKSGLYSRLVKENLLVKHREVAAKNQGGVYKIIKPELVKNIIYPYEWSFNQLKDVALQALRIQQISLKYGMSLKDCSAYNFQFVNMSPLLIDSLSFEKSSEGKPWTAYKQFCQHFLAPLALAYYCDQRLSNLLKHYLDGIPLDLASNLLPKSTYLKIPLLFNLHLHAKSQNIFSKKKQLGRVKSFSDKTMSANSIQALIDNLEAAIKSLSWKEKDSFWKDYYQDNSYSGTSFSHKKKIVSSFLNVSKKSKTVLDLGSNQGIFSFLAVEQGFETIALDYDHACIDRIYLISKKRGYKNILPIVNDLSNPSPALGWSHNERDSLMARFKSDIVLALALMHHLIIGNNVPLVKCVDFMAEITGKYLIIEYVPTDDSQVKEMVMLRSDFHNYSETDFVREFGKKFKVLKKEKVSSRSGRIMFLMEKRG